MNKVIDDASLSMTHMQLLVCFQTSYKGDKSVTVSPSSQLSRSSGMASGHEIRGGEESTKRRRLSSTKQAPESSASGDETLSALPCLVSLSPGVRIVMVAAGGRHTLALSGKFTCLLCC